MLPLPRRRPRLKFQSIASQKVLDLFGSRGRIRTSDQPVNSEFPRNRPQRVAIGCFNAPIPFGLAVVAAVLVTTVAIWRAMVWRYSGIIEMTRERVEWVADVAASKRKEDELTATVKKLEGKVQDLTESTGLHEETAMSDLKEIHALIHVVRTELSSLAASNNAAAFTLSQIPNPNVTSYPPPLPLRVGRGGNWPPPDKPEATSGS